MDRTKKLKDELKKLEIALDYKGRIQIEIMSDNYSIKANSIIDDVVLPIEYASQIFGEYIVKSKSLSTYGEFNTPCVCYYVYVEIPKSE